MRPDFGGCVEPGFGFEGTAGETPVAAFPAEGGIGGTPVTLPNMIMSGKGDVLATALFTGGTEGHTSGPSCSRRCEDVEPVNLTRDGSSSSGLGYSDADGLLEGGHGLGGKTVC